MLSCTLKQALSGNEIALLNMVYRIEIDNTLLVADDLNYIMSSKYHENKYLTYLQACVYTFGVPGVEKNLEKSKVLLKTLLGKQFFYVEQLMVFQDITQQKKSRFFNEALAASNPFALLNTLAIISHIDLSKNPQEQLVNLAILLGGVKIAYKKMIQTKYKDLIERILERIHSNLVSLPDEFSEFRQLYLKRKEEIRKDKYAVFHAVPNGGFSFAKSKPQAEALQELARTWVKFALLYEGVDTYAMFDALHQAYDLNNSNKEQVINKLSQQMYKSIHRSFDSFFKKTADFENYGEIQKYFSYVASQFEAAEKQLAKTYSPEALNEMENYLKKLNILVKNLKILLKEYQGYLVNENQLIKLDSMLSEIERRQALLKNQLSAKIQKNTVTITINAPVNSNVSTQTTEAYSQLSDIARTNQLLLENLEQLFKERRSGAKARETIMSTSDSSEKKAINILKIPKSDLSEEKISQSSSLITRIIG
ncbi:hypothetical protein A8135_09915 [Legionella jamestowniensis]|uniref:Purine NTPase n=1 Tax=Legionella jamestowniensis TaxID=455 RepID=A0ABX2XWL7_9GAMM|nr:hypothetical protein [Legionella jamestowniensis]OCH99049.1 hypothetical protein A8135_09915 [Legionella jamestowniensis]